MNLAESDEGIANAIRADAVKTGIHPYAELGPNGILRVNYSVAIIVVFREGLKAVGSETSILQPGLVAEEFATIIDNPIAVAIPNE